MPDAIGYHEPLLDRLQQTTLLSRTEAAKVVSDVLDYFSETTDQLVKRRHHELRSTLRTNDRIFAAILTELPYHRVRAPGLSTRQLRRIIYG